MTVEQKDRITALRNSGKSYAEIAKELGLGKSTVSNFCLRNGVEPGRNKLYPVNRTVGVLKNPTDRQAITLKFGQRIQAGIH